MTSSLSIQIASSETRHIPCQEVYNKGDKIVSSEVVDKKRLYSTLSDNEHKEQTKRQCQQHLRFDRYTLIKDVSYHSINIKLKALEEFIDKDSKDQSVERLLEIQYEYSRCLFLSSRATNTLEEKLASNESRRKLIIMLETWLGNVDPIFEKTQECKSPLVKTQTPLPLDNNGNPSVKTLQLYRWYLYALLDEMKQRNFLTKQMLVGKAEKALLCHLKVKNQQIDTNVSCLEANAIVTKEQLAESHWILCRFLNFQPATLSSLKTALTEFIDLYPTYKTLNAKCMLCRVKCSMKDPDAFTDTVECMSTVKQTYGETHPKTLCFCFTLALALCQAKRFDDSIRMIRQTNVNWQAKPREIQQQYSIYIQQLDRLESNVHQINQKYNYPS